MPQNLTQKNRFYNKHKNFTERTLIDYYISPGTMAKYDTIKEKIGNLKFESALDIGCSGNSFIHFLDNISNRTFLDLAHLPLTYYSKYEKHNPTVGSVTQIPFLDESFDLITGLDVIEHIYDDISAVGEILRVLKKNGILVITVPHRMKFYTAQDALIGHYRRYDLDQLRKLFSLKNLKELMVFGVYGQLMRYAQFFQKSNPEKLEDDLINLRNKYRRNPLFKKIFDKFVYFGSKIMKIDAKYQPIKNIMNICIIYKKLQ